MGTMVSISIGNYDFMSEKNTFGDLLLPFSKESLHIEKREYHDIDLVEGIFDKVCYELTQLLPDIKKTRWRGMVDFYTLFLVLAEKADRLPLTNEGRIDVREKLINFSNRVTQYQKQDGSKKEEETYIVEYASAIRNSSDLNSRKKRHAALSAFLSIK